MGPIAFRRADNGLHLQSCSGRVESSLCYSLPFLSVLVDVTSKHDVTLMMLLSLLYRHVASLNSWIHNVY